MNLINNINNKITILWQTIIKVSTLITLDINAKIKTNLFGAHNFIQLRFT